MKTDFDALLTKWQIILRLQDWSIGLMCKRHYDMEDNKAGTVGWCVRKKTAWIKILDPQDYQPNQEESMPADVEVVIVHELLHIHFAAIDDQFTGLKEDLFEQAIHDISSALVMLHRDHLNQ